MLAHFLKFVYLAIRNRVIIKNCTMSQYNCCYYYFVVLLICIVCSQKRVYLMKYKYYCEMAAKVSNRFIAPYFVCSYKTVVIYLPVLFVNNHLYCVKQHML